MTGEPVLSSIYIIFRTLQSVGELRTNESEGLPMNINLCLVHVRTLLTPALLPTLSVTFLYVSCTVLFLISSDVI